MITTKRELKEVLLYEKKCYYDYMFPTKFRVFMGWLRHEPIMQIWRWQKASRKADYYHYLCTKKNNAFLRLFHTIVYIYYGRKRNIMAERLSIEIDTTNIARGFVLFHGGATASGAIMGENCHLHGNNCLGNAGPGSTDTPKLGNNVMVGVGAKVIGAVTIADDVKIAAGAVVVKDITEKGCTVAGIPAVVVKHAE